MNDSRPLSSEDFKKRIVLVDDEEDMVFAVKLQLEAFGFEVITAHDGQQALEVIRSQKPDAVILDLMLPKIDGYKVCRMLKFDERFRDMPIIIFTARGEDNDMALAKEVGADAYLTKPFDSETLKQTLIRLLT